MKNYIYTFILVLAAAVTLGCTKEKDPFDSQTTKGRAVVPVDVSYLVDGSKISMLSFNHSAVHKDIYVEVNNENLCWNLESNRGWCKVAEGEHKGSGTVTLEIEANESLDAREPATLTFVAGEYRGFQINVSQTATAFIISQPYFISPKESQTSEVLVTLEAGTEWDIDCSEWITITKSNAVLDEGFETYTLHIIPDLNDGDSRFGSVILTSGQETESISVYQFGNEINYDEDGHILLDASGASFSFTAPAFIVSKITAPEFVKSTIVENGDGTATVTLTLEENLNDCAETRQVDASITLGNASASVIELPSMIQDFLPAGGLVTAKGLQAFAAAVANGGSTEAWEKDGVVTMIKDIDLTDVTGWAGVGTADAPFTGSFDGGGNAIKNLSSAAPLFNVCNGASISNVVIDKTCSLFTSTGPILGGLVNEARSTKISDCTVNAKVEFSSTETSAYVAGIAAFVDAESSIKNCKMNGTVKTSSAATLSSYLYLGGIAGVSSGSITNCETGGTITLASSHGTVRLGGIVSALPEAAVARTNSFLGKIELNGSVQKLFAGGLYGIIPEGSRTFDVSSDKSVSVGNVTLTNYYSNANTRLFVGGFVGKLEDGCSMIVNGMESQTKIDIDYTTVRDGEYLNVGGFLGGCEPDHTAEEYGELSFTNVSNSGEFSFNYKISVAVHIRRNCLGGIVGLVCGPATFTQCSNKATLGATKGEAYNANSNSYTMIMGGIAGHCYGGNMTFEGCTNDAKVATDFYSNRPAGHAVGNYFSSVATGGIIGTFNYKPNPQSYTLTVKNCSSKGFLSSMRGYIGGIAAYAYNAEFINCTWEGGSYALTIVNNKENDNLASYKGGIAGGAGNSTFTDCTAKGNLRAYRYGSATSADPGGIVGHVINANDLAAFAETAVALTNCSYFGELSYDASTVSGYHGYPGGLIGVSTAESTAENCRYGGKIQGVEVTSNTVDLYVFGNGLGTATNTQLWSGN